MKKFVIFSLHTLLLHLLQLLSHAQPAEHPQDVLHDGQVVVQAAIHQRRATRIRAVFRIRVDSHRQEVTVAHDVQFVLLLLRLDEFARLLKSAEAPRD